MKEPTTPEEVKVLHNLLRSDPQHYLQIVNKWIADNPSNSHAYFSRHFAWMKTCTHNGLLMTLTWSSSLSATGRVLDARRSLPPCRRIRKGAGGL